MSAWAWQDAAACPGIPVEDFFPPTYAVIPDEIAEACASCPAWGDCLDWAVENEPWGIWAGTTPDQRRKLRRKALRRKGRGDGEAA